MSVQASRIISVPLSAPRQREKNSTESVSANAGDMSIWARIVESEQICELRELAVTGRLAAVATDAVGERRLALSGAAFAVCWPVVFSRLTRSLERRRGHVVCASSVFRMAETCLDRFYDDVEAVIDDLLAHAKEPVRNLEAWVAARLNASTVNGHRRRRGEIGALQRPRMPMWLAVALGHDPWLTELATRILVWVGVPATAGGSVWPVNAWSLRRAVVMGGAVTGGAVIGGPGDAAATARDIDAVIAAMRTRPAWYQSYVERPLGRKVTPVVGSRDFTDPPPLLLTDRADVDDDHLVGLAADALRAIEARLMRGQRAADAVIEVIEKVFSVDTGGEQIDCPPLSAPQYDEHVTAALRDPHHVRRIVDAVLSIVAQPAIAQPPVARPAVARPAVAPAAVVRAAVVPSQPRPSSRRP